MPATPCAHHGEGIWGINDPETGLLVSNITSTSKSSEAVINDNSGNTVGLSLYECQADIVIDAYLPKQNPCDWLLGAAVTLANAIPKRIPNDTGAGSLLVKGSTDTWANTDHQKVAFNATYYPGIPAGSAP
jgi:hypothetical protein